FPIPLDDPELFTATPRWQEFIRADPLSLRRATARLLVESALLDAWLRWAPRRVRAPVLLLLAGHHPILHNPPTPAHPGRFGSAEKEVIEYPEAHHTLEFEPDPGRYFADLAGWLRRKAEGR